MQLRFEVFERCFDVNERYPGEHQDQRAIFINAAMLWMQGCLISMPVPFNEMTGLLNP